MENSELEYNDEDLEDLRKQALASMPQRGNSYNLKAEEDQLVSVYYQQQKGIIKQIELNYAEVCALAGLRSLIFRKMEAEKALCKETARAIEQQQIMRFLNFVSERLADHEDQELTAQLNEFLLNEMQEYIAKMTIEKIN